MSVAFPFVMINDCNQVRGPVPGHWLRDEISNAAGETLINIQALRDQISKMDSVLFINPNMTIHDLLGYKFDPVENLDQRIRDRSSTEAA